MKTNLAHLDKYREPHSLTGLMTINGDPNGQFRIPHFDYKERDRYRTHFIVISSDGQGWDHVSAHVRGVFKDSRVMRTPTWDEMCWLKSQFFDDHETVVQFHPKRSEHVNVHQHVLHLWRKQGEEYELPPSLLV